MSNEQAEQMIVVTIGVTRYALPKHCKTSAELFASAYAEHGKEVRCASYKKPYAYRDIARGRYAKHVSIDYLVDVLPVEEKPDEDKTLQELCEKEDV